MPVIVRVLDAQHGLVFRRADLVREEAVIDVVLERRREEAQHFEMMLGDLFRIQGVDHHRHDADDAIVHRADQPCRPAALGSSRDHELIDRNAAAIGRLHEFLRGVHGLDASLHHGETDEPLVVLGREVLHARVGDDIVLEARLVLGVSEVQRLVRHHADFGDDRAGFLRDADGAVLRLGRRRDRCCRPAR